MKKTIIFYLYNKALPNYNNSCIAFKSKKKHSANAGCLYTSFVTFSIGTCQGLMACAWESIGTPRLINSKLYACTPTTPN